MSFATRSGAVLVKATVLPSALRIGFSDAPSRLGVPPTLALTRSVVPVASRRAKTSVNAFASLATRSVASLVNATVRPSALRLAASEAPLPLSVPAAFMLASVVVPESRSRTNTSVNRFVSLAARSEARLVKAT